MSANTAFLPASDSPREVPRHPAALGSFIRLQLRLRGMTLPRLAEQHGLCRQALYQAIAQPSARCEQIIAEAIGLTPRELWPDRFGYQGTRLHTVRSNIETIRQAYAAPKQRPSPADPIEENLEPERTGGPIPNYAFASAGGPGTEQRIGGFPPLGLAPARTNVHGD